MRVPALLPRRPVTWLVIAALVVGVPVWAAGVLYEVFYSAWLVIPPVFGFWGWFLWRAWRNQRRTWYDFSPGGIEVNELSTNWRLRTREWRQCFAWSEIGYLEAVDGEAVRFWYGPREQFMVWFSPSELDARLEEFRKWQGGRTKNDLPAEGEVEVDHERGVRTTSLRFAGKVRAVSRCGTPGARPRRSAGIANERGGQTADRRRPRSSLPGSQLGRFRSQRWTPPRNL